MQVTSSNPQVRSSHPRVRTLKARVRGETKSTSWENSRTSWGLTARVRRLKARVEARNHELDGKYTSQKRKFSVRNIEFHELQKVLIFFHCLANVEASHNGFEKTFPQHGFKTSVYVATMLPSYFSSKDIYNH